MIISSGDCYHELVRAFPLRVLRAEGELDRAIEMLESLWEDSTPDVGEYRLALAVFVERYEEQQYPMGHVTPADMLRHLMEAKGVTGGRVSDETGIPPSVLSEILEEEREMGLDVLKTLAGYFHVHPGVFL